MKIALIGTGLYSTAITYHLQKMKDNEIYLWTENQKLAKEFKNKRKFEFLSKNIKFDSNVYVSNDIQTVITDASVVFLLISSKYFENTLKEIKPFYKKNTPIFVGTKGMDLEHIKFYSDITRKFLKCNSYSFFAGPTFAKDLLTDYPFSLTYACSNNIAIKKIPRIFPEYIEYETTKDLYGLEITAVLKNIYAIGCGILEGLKVPESVYYSYLTKVLKETNIIIKKCNGDTDTLLSYGSIGDFLMTTSSKNSRNYTLGKMIGSKAKKTEIEEYKQKNTLEGLENLLKIPNLLHKLKIKNSILETLYQIIQEEKKCKELIPKIVPKKEEF